MVVAGGAGAGGPPPRITQGPAAGACGDRPVCESMPSGMRSWSIRQAGFLASLVLLFVVVHAADGTLPAAPAGFAWTRLKEIRADILKPSGWALSHQRKGGSETYKLAAPKSGNSAGAVLDINWVSDVPGKAAMPPTRYVATLVAAAADNHKLMERSSGTRDAFATASFRFQDSGPGRDGIMVQYQFFANDRTGSLCITAFEAPTRIWTNAWATGRILTEQLRLDPGF